MRDPRFADASGRTRYNRATPEEVSEARANARALAEGQADVALLLKALEALEGRETEIWRAFDEELVAAASQEPTRRDAWTTVLQDALEARRTSLSAGPVDKQDARDKREVDAASRDWHERTDPFSVWSNRDPHVSHDRGDIWTLTRVLLQISPADGLRAVDALPYPGLMKEVLYLLCREDRTLIEGLLEAAPVVFDDQGNWRSERSVVALLMIELVAQHADSLHEP